MLNMAQNWIKSHTISTVLIVKALHSIHSSHHQRHHPVTPNPQTAACTAPATMNIAPIVTCARASSQFQSLSLP